MRRGEMMQPFLIILFVFFLIVAIALLTLQTKKLQTTRPELQKDLLDQRASTLLISLMRTKMIDDATLGESNFADVIIMNENDAYDQLLARNLLSNIPPDTYLVMRIEYKTHTLYLQNIGEASPINQPALFSKTQLTLPGSSQDIKITAYVSTKQTFENAGEQLPVIHQSMFTR